MSSDGAALALQVQRYLEMGRKAEARGVLGRLLALDPQDVQALFLAAQLEYDDGQSGAARARLTDVLARAPHHAGARLLWFHVEFDDGNTAAAETRILELLRESPDNAQYLAQYARLMFRVYQLEKARALVDEALRREPHQPLAQVLDALLHVIHRDDAGASGRLATLMAQDPEAAHVGRLAMVVLEAKRRHREALQIGRQLLRVEPNDQQLIEMLIELRLRTHWSMKPLWPFVRFGWGGAIAVWVIGVFVTRTLARSVGYPQLGQDLLVVYLVYIAYSWIWPPLLRRWLRARGI